MVSLMVKTKKPVIGVVVSPGLKSAVINASAKLDCSQNEVVRMALNRFLGQAIEEELTK